MSRRDRFDPLRLQDVSSELARSAYLAYTARMVRDTVANSRRLQYKLGAYSFIFFTEFISGGANPPVEIAQCALLVGVVFSDRLVKGRGPQEKEALQALAQVKADPELKGTKRWIAIANEFRKASVNAPMADLKKEAEPLLDFFKTLFGAGDEEPEAEEPSGIMGKVWNFVSAVPRMIRGIPKNMPIAAREFKEKLPEILRSAVDAPFFGLMENLGYALGAKVGFSSLFNLPHLFKRVSKSAAAVASNAVDIALSAAPLPLEKVQKGKVGLDESRQI